MKNISNKKFKIKNNLYYIFFTILIMGMIMSFYGYIKDNNYNLLIANLLINSYYFTIVSLFGAFFYAIQYLSYSKWSVVLLKISNIYTKIYPYFAIILLLIILYGLLNNIIYTNWSNGELIDIFNDKYDFLIHKKSYFLNKKFFLLRLITYFLVWYFLIFKINNIDKNICKYSIKEFFNKNITYSAIFCFIFAFTFPLFIFDVIMSLEPHWFSTIFGWYNLSILWVSGLCFLTLTSIILKENGSFSCFNKNHLKDLSNYIFAFSIFWMYLLTCQTLLIWYSNIPEETVWYINRLNNGYKNIYIVNIVMNFILPLLLLLHNYCKINFNIVKIICIIIIIGHWIDIYIMIIPSIVGIFPGIGFLDIGIFMMFFSIFMLMIFNKIKNKNIYIIKHPYLINSINY